MILAGDIGGTNSRLALYDHEQGPRSPLALLTYPSGAHTSLRSVVEEFLAATGATVSAAAFGVAGPVLDGKARITNLPWVIDRAELSAHLGGAPVALVNDLVATANALPHLAPHEVAALDDSVPVPGGPIGVIAPGTGLGEAYLVWDGAGYRAMPSEGGHASFAPRTEVEIDLLRSLSARFGHVSYERVCSGSGIPLLFEFFRDRHPDELDSSVAAAIDAAVDAAADPAPLILAAALDPTGPDAVCRRTIETFVSILGAETGNLALKLLATGGMYLAGGIPPRIVPLLQSGRFRSTYSHKGRFGAMVAAIPVHVVLEPGTGLLGAAVLGLATDGGRR